MGPTHLILMDSAEQKQRYSFAYVRAVAAAAGFTVNEYETDDGIDLVIGCKGLMGQIIGPKIDLQVKCTSEEVLKAQGRRGRLPHQVEELP